MRSEDLQKTGTDYNEGEDGDENRTEAASFILLFTCGGVSGDLASYILVEAGSSLAQTGAGVSVCHFDVRDEGCNDEGGWRKRGRG